MTQILILGEAWGEQEEKARSPFVGYTGQELTRMLSEAGINRADCFLTNVFNHHPPGNKVEWFCGGKDEKLEGYPPLVKGKYVDAKWAPELARLAEEIRVVKPNVILALGNTASWALLGRTGITKFRGTTDISSLTASGVKVLPTYHPSAVVRQWELRPTAIMDFLKAKRESEYPELRRPRREIWIEPTLEDLHVYRQRYIDGCEILSVDIETAGNTITCIGFAPNSKSGIVIPFLDTRRKERSFWPTPSAEIEAWCYVKSICESPAIPKLFQNGLYDIAFLWRANGIKVRGAIHDTMLLHHALQPEALKGLGYLGSIYTDEGAWKQMRGKSWTIKRDE